MSGIAVEGDDQRRELLELYDSALPAVYGYLASRCGSASVAEDLTSDTFLAAVAAVRDGKVAELTVAWLIGVARHKLVDHWRRREREERALIAVQSDAVSQEDPWDLRLDRMTAHQVLETLGAHHRSALTLRYLDGLPVRQVAHLLGRTAGATEVLLVPGTGCVQSGLRRTHHATGRGRRPMTAHDPFDDLAMPVEPQQPRSDFARSLRTRLLAELGLDDEPPPTVQLPERKQAMSTTVPAPSIVTAVTPYLAVHDAAAALGWYTDAFGAVEQMRVVGDDGRVGHAEFHIGTAVFYLSDEYPDIGVVSPRTLGGSAFALHLAVTGVDTTFTRAVAAGATALQEPEDQPHGARHGTLVDPFGHRWMLSQQVEQLSVEEYAARAQGSGFEVVAADLPGTSHGETIAAADRPGTGGGIWAGVFYRDALAAIRFLVDTFGFEEQLVVIGDDGHTVVHSQLRWPEGGIVQAGTYDPESQFTHPPGEQALYVVTANPQPVWERCQAAGLEVVREPESPDYDPGGMGFGVRDPEGNIWTFGTYGLGQAT